MFDPSSTYDWLGQGFLLSMGLAYLGGLAVSLTPCVYPLIPITIGVMGAQKTTTRWGAFALSGLFVLGIALVYSSLGVLAASTGKVLGVWGQSPMVVGPLALLFVVLGLGLLGLYNLALPPSVMTWISKRGGNHPMGVFVMGMASGILAAPCAGPVSIGILAIVAQGGDLLWGFGVLFAYALGIGFPFLLLGTFSQLLTRIPRSGIWLIWVKSLCGIAMMVAAVLFSKAFLSPPGILLAIGGIFLITGLMFRKAFPIPHSPTLSRLVRTSLVIVAVLFSAQAGLSHSPEQEAGSTESADSFWIYSEAKALKLARENSRPVFVDFWAKWCEACKELDQTTFSDPRVREWLETYYIRLKLDVSDMTGPVSQGLLEKYGVLGMPALFFLRPSGYIEKSLSLTGFVEPDDFLAHLKRAQKAGLHTQP